MDSWTDPEECLKTDQRWYRTAVCSSSEWFESEKLVIIIDKTEIAKAYATQHLLNF